jgi:hypothetical protein
MIKRMQCAWEIMDLEGKDGPYDEKEIDGLAHHTK